MGKAGGERPGEAGEHGMGVRVFGMNVEMGKPRAEPEYWAEP